MFLYLPHILVHKMVVVIQKSQGKNCISFKVLFNAALKLDKILSC